MSDKFDRLQEWDVFSKEMRSYIESFTVPKYGAGTDEDDDIDFIKMTKPSECIWSIMKYCLRMRKNQGKKFDLLKVAHYAQLAWSRCNGDLTKVGIQVDKIS